MTKDQFMLATDIMEDIRIINKMCLPNGVSDTLKNDFEEWKNKTIEKYKTEFYAL